MFKRLLLLNVNESKLQSAAAFELAFSIFVKNI